MTRIFMEVLNVSIMAGWMIMAVLLLRLLMKKAPAWVRCSLWGIVGLRLLWPFHITSGISLIPSRYTLPYGQLYRSAPELDTGIHLLDAVINPAFSMLFQSEPSNSVNPLQVVAAVAGQVWLVGLLVMAEYILLSYLWLNRGLRVCAPLEGNAYLCDHVQTPFILGIRKPKIYLPTTMAEEEYPQILAHERAHLERKDHWWKLLGFVLLTVHWFNPLMWVAYRLLCRDMECAADERVIRDMPVEKRKVYCETLLRYSVSRSGLGACPLAFGEVDVKQRIKSVLRYQKPMRWVAVAAVVLCIVMVLCFLTEPGYLRQPEDITGKSFHLLGNDYFDQISISIHENGVYNYCSGGLLSSTIHVGNWELEGNTLRLREWVGDEQTREYYFTVTGDGIIYRAESSTGSFCGLEEDVKFTVDFYAWHEFGSFF